MPLMSPRHAVLALALLTVSSLALAQYVGPGTMRNPTSLTEVIQSPVDGQSVQLRGKLLQKLNHNKYLFSDGKSQIRVQINSENFPKQAIDDRTEIEIVGQVEKDFMDTPEIDVTSVDIKPVAVVKPR